MNLEKIVKEAVEEVLEDLKGVPKRDGSGRGLRMNRGRGGCPPESQRRTPRRRPRNIPDGIGRGQGGEGRGLRRE